MNKRKLLILGSDYGTVDMIHEAHKMGLYVIVSDTMSTSPSKELADEAWMISTTDIDALEQKCKEENIGGIGFGASDFNVGNARILCKRLGLPIYCEDDYAWKISRDKSEFKKLCIELEVPVADDYILTDELNDQDLEKIKYPVVVKPVDKSGNRGMSYCNNKEELIEAYKYARSISDNPRIVVERQLHGPEYYVNYIIADGEIRLLYYTIEHQPEGQLANLYSIINTTSGNLPLWLEEMNEKVKNVFAKANCKNGIAWVESILDSDGHFYLLEMGYRYGGEMIYRPYELVNGFSSIKFMVQLCMGEKLTGKDLPKSLDEGLYQNACAYYMFTLRDGIIGSIKGLDEIESIPNVFPDFPKRVGNAVRKLAALGIFRIYANNLDEMIDTLKKINSIIEIKDENGENLIIKFEDYNKIINEFKLGLSQFHIDRTELHSILANKQSHP